MSECEAEEETTHLSGLSLETGGDGNHFPRAAQPGNNKKIQVKVSECEAGEDEAHLSGLSLGMVVKRESQEWHRPVMKKVTKLIHK